VVLKGRACAAQKAALQVVVKADSVVPQALRATSPRTLPKVPDVPMASVLVVPEGAGVLAAPADPKAERPGMFGDPKEMFKRMDADANGSVSEEEYIKATEKMREMMRSRGGQPGQPGQPGQGGGPSQKAALRVAKAASAVRPPKATRRSRKQTSQKIRPNPFSVFVLKSHRGVAERSSRFCLLVLD
jgi:hypothetical protein